MSSSRRQISSSSMSSAWVVRSKMPILLLPFSSSSISHFSAGWAPSSDLAFSVTKISMSSFESNICLTMSAYSSWITNSVSCFFLRHSRCYFWTAWVLKSICSLDACLYFPRFIEKILMIKEMYMPMSIPIKISGANCKFDWCLITKSLNCKTTGVTYWRLYSMRERRLADTPPNINIAVNILK